MQNSAVISSPAVSDEDRLLHFHSEVSARAQELWMQYGMPVGRHEEIWLEAENDVLGARVPEMANPASAPSQTVPTTPSWGSDAAEI